MKGSEFHIPQHDNGTNLALVLTQKWEMSLRHLPELWKELVFFLHNPPGPWNSSRIEWVLVGKLNLYLPDKD